MGLSLVITCGMYVELYKGSNNSGTKSMTSSKSVVLLRTRLLFSLNPSSDKARLFLPVLPSRPHVVWNDAVVWCLEHSTIVLVMLQTAAWSCKTDASVAQEQYFCLSWAVFSSTGLAEKRLLDVERSTLRKKYKMLCAICFIFSLETIYCQDLH